MSDQDMREAQRALIGVDAGGTTMAAGLVTRDGQVLATVEASSRLGSKNHVEQIVDMIGRLRAQGAARGLAVEAVGIGIAGLVDSERGRLARTAAAHMTYLEGAPLTDRILATTGLPAFVDNDVNALALGESLFGLARGTSSSVVLAIGSGVGAGIIVDGRLVRGRQGYAGEFGHAPIELEGPACVCGGRGCLSVYICGDLLPGEARRMLASEPSSMPALAGGDASAITAETIFRAAAAGDPLARRLVDRGCRALGAGLATLVNTLAPEIIVVTGGVVHSLLPLEDEILRRAREYALAESLAGTRIHLVPGDKGQTVRGGAALVLYERARRAGRGGVDGGEWVAGVSPAPRPVGEIAGRPATPASGD